MALAFVQRAQGGGAGSASSITATFGSGTAAGNLLVALINDQATLNVSSVTDSAGNTWVQAGSEFKPGGNAHQIWYVANAAANAGTVTVNLTSASTYRALVIYEISGAATSSVLNTTATGGPAGGNTVTSGSITLAAAEEIICAIGVGTPSLTPGTGYTGVNFAVTGDANAYFIDEYHIVTANEAASYTDSGTGGTILAASFKAAVGGATGSRRPRTRSLLGIGM